MSSTISKKKSNFILIKNIFRILFQWKKIFRILFHWKNIFRILFQWNFFFEFYFIEKKFFFFSILFQWKKYFSNFFNDFFFWKSRWLSLRFFLLPRTNPSSKQASLSLPLCHALNAPNTPQCRWMWRNACSKNDWILMSKMKSFLSFYPSSIPCISKFNVDFLCVQFQSLQYYLA